MRFFSADADAVFLRRPNRFIIIAEADGREVRCHCPNPGRMFELLAPGCSLILEKRRNDGGAKRATGWTAAAVRYRGGVVPLYSARANSAAADLIIPRLFPHARSVESEATIGRSRFDFKIEDEDGSTHLLEVKACSLVERGTAMFPDAPSARAVRHLEELAALAREGYRTHVLFAVLHGDPVRFVPNLHTDPEFAAALSRASADVDLRAVLLGTDEAGETRLIRESIPVDTGYGPLASENRGSYLVCLELERSSAIEIGKLGTIDFAAGWYVYSGSAQKGLSGRIARHRRRTRKAKRWHLDYLTPFASRIETIPIASYDNLECESAAALRGLGGIPVRRFGSSDCGCGSHLHYFRESPLGNREFIELILALRHERALEHR